MSHNQTIKILILGDKSSGKSSLIRRYIIDDYEDEYNQTIANDFYITESNRNDKQLSVQVWDIVDYTTINKILLKSIHCIVFVVDITSSNCNNTLELLYNQINVSNVPIVVVGSKIDKSIDNEITINTINDIKLWMKYKKIIINNNLSDDLTHEQTNTLNNDLNIHTNINNFIITTAKSNINIDYLFDYIIHLSYNTILSKSNQNILLSSSLDTNTNNYITKSPNSNPNQSNSRQETKEEEKIDNTNVDSLLKVKVIMVGSSNTGKSSLISKYLNESKDIDSAYQPTIGTDLHVINLTVKDQPLMIQLWDTAGDQSKYNLTKTIYKNADCLVLVYDITSVDSFHGLNSYWDDFYQSNKIIERFDFPVLLVGNKTDLSANRAITLEEVLDWCYKKRPQAPITYMECSSYQNIGIQDLFIYIADAVYEFVAGVDESYIEEEDELDDDRDNDNDEVDDDEDEDDIEDNEVIEPVDQEVAILLDDSKTYKSNTEKANSRRRSVTSVNRNKVFEPDVERNCWFTIACFPGFA